MTAEIAIARNAKNSILIADAEESVNMLSLFSLILFVSGTADDAEDINKYAATCNSMQGLNIQEFIIQQWNKKKKIEHKTNLITKKVYHSPISPRKYFSGGEFMELPESLQSSIQCRQN